MFKSSSDSQVHPLIRLKCKLNFPLTLWWHWKLYFYVKDTQAWLLTDRVIRFRATYNNLEPRHTVHVPSILAEVLVLGTPTGRTNDKAPRWRNGYTSLVYIEECTQCGASSGWLLARVWPWDELRFVTSFGYFCSHFSMFYQLALLPWRRYNLIPIASKRQ